MPPAHPGLKSSVDFRLAAARQLPPLALVFNVFSVVHTDLFPPPLTAFPIPASAFSRS